MKIFFIVGLFLWMTGVCAAQEVSVDRELMEYYKEEGRKEAEQMVLEYYAMQKPQFQNAYADYLNDLKSIALTGKAPDNQLLYDDLRKMNSEEEFLYSDSEEKYYRK